jgi:MFS transporter, DHA2 family, methylenomycin A resistance protein
VQGVGAALLLPGSLAIITETFPDRAARAKALGIWAGVSSLALPAGPLLGGFLVASGGWRLIFLVNVPVVLAALVAIPWLVPAGSARPDRQGDTPGTVLAAIGLAAAVFAVIDAGEQGLRPSSVVGLVVAVVCVAGFVVRERNASAPMLPLDLLRRPAFVGPNLSAGSMNFVINGLLFVTTLFLQGVQHRDALAAGVALLPMFLPLALLSPLAGRLAARFGPRPLLIAGALVAALGAAGFALFEPASGYLALLPALLGLGIGAGLFTAPVVTAAMAAVPAERSGLASGINNTARQTGTALGVAVFGAVAGGPAAAGTFVHEVHVLAGFGAAVWLAVAGLVARSLRRPSPTSILSG